MIPWTEVKVLDVNSARFGVTTAELMECAGKAVADVIEKNFDLKNKLIAVICGTGNNGGDGFVCARYLSKRARVVVGLLKPATEIKSREARLNFKRLRCRTVVGTEKISELVADAEIIVDAIFGVGLRGEILEPYRKVLSMLNSSGKPIISIDVPSGLGLKGALKPAITVTFHDVKEGMNKKNSGQIIVADIGIPKEAELYTGPGEFVYYPLPASNSHKGDNGRVLVIGGGPYTGAPALAALAAYRTGVDLVYLAVPSRIFQVVAAYSPNFIVHELEGVYLSSTHAPAIQKLMEKVDAVLIGPGIGTVRSTRELVRRLVASASKPLVIDADAFDAIAEMVEVLRGHCGILTPHAGEYAKLTGEPLSSVLETRCEQVKKLAMKTGFTVLSKGSIDVISDGKRLKLNRTGNAGMSVGGTGDVLAGICVALLAKKLEPFNAARLAAFINGYAGDIAFEEKYYSLLATDLIEKIPTVIKLASQTLSNHST